ncbi:Uncharacterised protein [Mycobacteroides abscessus]|nr:Uncharacterised protein [Mycobacteroides abscessus]
MRSRTGVPRAKERSSPPPTKNPESMRKTSTPPETRWTQTW